MTQKLSAVQLHLLAVLLLGVERAEFPIGRTEAVVSLFFPNLIRHADGLRRRFSSKTQVQARDIDARTNNGHLRRLAMTRAMVEDLRGNQVRPLFAVEIVKPAEIDLQAVGIGKAGHKVPWLPRQPITEDFSRTLPEQVGDGKDLLRDQRSWERHLELWADACAMAMVDQGALATVVDAIRAQGIRCHGDVIAGSGRYKVADDGHRVWSA